MGQRKVQMDERDSVGASARIQAGRQWAVNPQQELLASLNLLTGENSVELVY